MTEKEYRNYMIVEITTKKKAWCKRYNETRETLEQKQTRTLEAIFDRAK